MRYYKVYLIRRFILDIFVDSEIEENMVEWLRVSKFFLMFGFFNIVYGLYVCLSNIFW